jgi:hypothetical protein
MPLKGTMRSLGAAVRRAERDAQRRRRELEGQRKQLEKMQELERATYEVEVYENYIELLSSVHKECGDSWNWEAIECAALPSEPKKTHVHEELAQTALDEFKPSFFDKVRKRVDSKYDELTKAIEDARETDEREYQEAFKTYQQECADWEVACNLATQVLSGDHEAYLDAIKLANPFSDIAELGSSVEFQVHSRSIIGARLCIQDKDVIPSEVKSLLKTGKLSVKAMPKTKLYTLYQDYICSCVLRVARELHSLLPIDMVIVNAIGELLNSQTGYMEEKPVLSVAIPRETLNKLNFAMLAPSDSMDNFVHRMTFSKTRGFQAVEVINPSDL